MKTSDKIFLDQLLCRPAAWFVSILHRAGRLLPRSRKVREVRRICVCKLMGMGSIIQSTALLLTLKKKFPEAEICFVTTPAHRELLLQAGCADRILLIDDRGAMALISSTLRLLREWVRRPADLYFDLEVYSWFSTLLAGLSFAGRRFGLETSPSGFRSTLYTDRVAFGPEAVVPDAYLSMAALAGATALHRHPVRFTAGTSNYPLPCIVVNPNASDLRLERRWPAAAFSSLIRHLLDRYPEHTLVLTGTEGEARHTQHVMDGVGKTSGRLINACGKLSLRAFTDLVGNSSVVVTNDSGPMHLAAAMGRPVVALFGPGSPGSYRFPSNVQAIYEPVHCSPCVHAWRKSPCGGDNRCMQRISVEEVLSACEKILAPSAQARALVTRSLSS